MLLFLQQQEGEIMSEILFPNQSADKYTEFYKAYMTVGPFTIENVHFGELGNRRNNFHWQLAECVKYALFIEFHRQKMQGKCHSRLWKVYEAMSKHIKTRNYRQCKLYHQRMMEQHKTVNGILGFLIENYPMFQEFMNKERETIRNYEIPNGVEKMSSQDLIATDAAYYLGLESGNSQALVRIHKNKEQALRQCEQVFSSWASKLKNFILPQICFEKA